MTKDVRIEGLISKRIIKLWLENYEDIEGSNKGIDLAGGRAGTKARDGKGKQLNKIMLDAAIKDLPPVLKVCTEYRWLKGITRGEALRRTGIPKSTYYRRCDKAVEFIYYHVNGIAAGMKDLLEKIL